MGSVVYRVQWTCSSEPALVRLTWEIYWNDTLRESATADVEWTGDLGEVTVSPSYTPTYTFESMGATAFKLKVTDDVNFREASVGCTVVPV